MRKGFDITGQTYGRWTVLGRDRDNPKAGSYWLCRCACGTEKSIRIDTIRGNGSRSCGCLAAEIQRARITQYPEWPTRTGASSYVVEKDGKRQTLKEWAKELDIQLPILIVRWNRGWSDDEILRPTKSQLEAKLAIPDPLFDIEKGEEELPPSP